MRVDATTGFSVGTHDLPHVPARGNVFHIGEFTYWVNQVRWVRKNGVIYPELYLLPIKGSDVRRHYTSYRDRYSLERAPNYRTDDVIDLYNTRSYRVSNVEWYVKQADPRMNMVVFHLTRLAEEDPAIAEVLRGAEEYGQRYIKAGINPS